MKSAATFAAGMLAGILVAVAIMVPVAERDAARVAASWQNVAADAKQSTDAQDGTIAALTLQRDTCQAEYLDVFSRVTVLYDTSAAPAPSIPLLGGFVTIELGPQHRQANARWVIPAKVTPVIIGDANGIAYSFVDPKTGASEGPFAPERPTQ